jgi:hypothetical protein
MGQKRLTNEPFLFRRSASARRIAHRGHARMRYNGVMADTPKDPSGESMNLPEAKLPWSKQLQEMPMDFRSSFHWRVFRIMAEFVDGWQFITDYKNTVSILGSARSSRQ